MPRVSVIIPCYNVEKYLPECLDSVIGQTFSDIEIICVNDGSTDNTLNILEKYKKQDKRIKIINQENKGLAISRNIGLDKAHAEYVYFLDSDDYISRDCIEKLYNQTEKDKCDIVIGGVNVYPENKNDDFCVSRATSLQSWFSYNPVQKLQITEQNSDEYYGKIYCCAWNKLYKRKFLIDNDIYFINKKCFHEDNGFWLKVLACNPVISTINTKTYFYRIRNSSITEMTESDKKLHVLHLKDSLSDALFFAKSKNNKTLSNFMYYEIYTMKKHRIFYLVWTKFEKRLKLLSYPIFGLKFYVNKNQYKLKILGIPVYKWRKN